MNARLALGLLMGLLVGCSQTGGQTGEIGADPCDFQPGRTGGGWPRADHGLTDPTPMGVSGQEAIDATGGSGSFEVAWANGKKSAVSWSLAADIESSPVVQFIDRKGDCGDALLQVLVLGDFSSADGTLDHEQRGELYRGDDGTSDLRLAFFFNENPFPDVHAGGGSGDSCADCSGNFELSFELRWEAGASAPRGRVDLIENGKLLGEVGTF